MAGGLLSTWLIVVAARLDAPPALLLRMGLNIGVDALVGGVPLLGDLFDFAWKSNRRNLALLELHLADPGRARRSSRVWIGVVAGLTLVLVTLVLIGGFVAGAAALRWLGRHV